LLNVLPFSLYAIEFGLRLESGNNTYKNIIAGMAQKTSPKGLDVAAEGGYSSGVGGGCALMERGPQHRAADKPSASKRAIARNK